MGRAWNGRDDDKGLQTTKFGFAFLELLHSTVELSASAFLCSSLLIQSVFERLFLFYHGSLDERDLAFCLL